MCLKPNTANFKKRRARWGLWPPDKKAVINAGNIPMAAPLTIPIHVTTISGPLYYAILKQLGMSETEFKALK